MVQTNWEVHAWKEQLAKAGVPTDDWEVVKTFPHATKVKRTFERLQDAQVLFTDLRARGLPAFKNWIG